MQRSKRQLTLICAALLAGAAVAQPGGQGGLGRGGPGPGGPGGGRGPMILLQMRSVQQELNLTADQIARLDQVRPGPGAQGRRQGPPPQGERPPQREDPLSGILSEAQRSRLRQLQLQWDSPMTLLSPEASDKLNLTESQRQRIDAIVAELRPERGGPGGRGQGQGQRPPQPPPHQDWAAMLAAKTRAAQAALQVLDQRQKATWSQMIGAPFSRWEEPIRRN